MVSAQNLAATSAGFVSELGTRHNGDDDSDFEPSVHVILQSSVLDEATFFYLLSLKSIVKYGNTTGDYLLFIYTFNLYIHMGQKTGVIQRYSARVLVSN